jgi:hypothetical protein
VPHQRFSLALFVRAPDANKRVLKFFTPQTSNDHTHPYAGGGLKFFLQRRLGIFGWAERSLRTE